MKKRIRAKYPNNIPAEEEIKVIQDMQKNRTWKQNDYVHKELEAGNENYKILDKFCRKHTMLQEKDGKLKYPYVAMFLTGKHCHGVLKDGTFRCKESDIEAGDKLVDEVTRVLAACGLLDYGRPVAPCTTMWLKHRNQIDLVKLEKFMGNKRDHKVPDNLRGIQKTNESQWNMFFIAIKGCLK